MKKKIGLALILSCFFCLLLHSIPVGYATTVESEETPPMEGIESVNNLGDEENLESVENPVSKETESVATEETTDSVTDEHEHNEVTEIHNRSVTNRSLVNLSLFNETNLYATLDNKDLNLSFVGTGLNVSLLEGLLDIEIPDEGLLGGLLGGLIDLLDDLLAGITGDSNMLITFFLPPDIDVNTLDMETDISVKFSNGSDDFQTIDDLTLVRGDEDSNTISFRVPKGILGISIEEQIYQMSITLDEPIANPDGQIEFGAVASDGALIDVDLLSNTGYKTATVSVPTPPMSPTILPIYSNTMVIRGTLPSDFQTGSTVYIDLGDGIQRSAEVSDGGFSLAVEQSLAVGSKIEASIVTIDGLSSPIVSTVVQQAPPPLIVPEVLDFGTVSIGSDITYKFLETPLEIIIQDTRGIHQQWQLQASITQPLTSTESDHTLPNALGFYENGEFSPFITNATETKGEAITIKTATTKNDEAVKYHWDPEQMEGPAIKIDHSAVYAEPYSTDITWTLVDAPLP